MGVQVPKIGGVMRMFGSPSRATAIGDAEYHNVRRKNAGNGRRAFAALLNVRSLIHWEGKPY